MPQYQGVWSLAQQAQALTSQQWVTDPFFDYTTLLLQADGTSTASQNNTFLDSSSNRFTITRNGNTTQGTFSPFSLQPGAWGVYSPSVYASTNFTSRTLFNGNSTIELWVYPNALSGQQTFVLGGGINFGTNNAKLRIDDGVNAGSVFESTGTITANVWNHVAVVRSSNTFSFYINGNFDSSNASISSFYTSNATSLNTGAFNSVGQNAFFGYFSNIRVSNIARTISLPTSPYTSDANTVWLIYQSNRFVDNSSNGYTFTFVGTPSVQAFSPFAPQYQYSPTVTGGSGYFDGTGDELSIPDNAAFNLTGDFTIEAWVYPTVRNTNNQICTQWGGVGNAPFIFKYDSNGRLVFVWTVGGGSGNTFSATSTTVLANAWNHVAVTRSGNTLRFFVNGVVDATTAAITGSITNGTNPIYIGSLGGSEYITGYMASFRFINGQALATATFTPPTAPINATQVGWNGSTASITGTVAAVLNFTNAGIYDATLKNNLETVGNAQISTSIVKYGSGSLAFDGTGDSLKTAPTQVLPFRTGSFTIEMWVFVSAYNAGYNLLCSNRTSGGADGTSLTINGQKLTVTTSGSVLLTCATTLSVGQWYHVAFVRNGTTNCSVYLNGVLDGTFTDSRNYTGTSMLIGGGEAGNADLNGYIDDFRVTRGIARYTRNFTPPQVALPRQ